jgi:type IV secretion system protein TrbG
MNHRVSILVPVAALCACASHHRIPDPPLDNFVEAHPLAEPPRPLQIVEIPHPIPMPSQLKPLPELSPPTPVIPAKESIHQANVAARMEPTPSGFINAMQVWPFSPAALYQVYTMPGKITDIALEPGEDILDVSAPDPVRWIIGDTKSGTGPEERRHVVVKPTRADLQCNLAIFTSRRTLVRDN